MSWVIGQRVIERTIDILTGARFIILSLHKHGRQCGIVDEWLEAICEYIRVILFSTVIMQGSSRK